MVQGLGNSMGVKKKFMYATLPFRRLLAVLLWPFAMILVAVILLRGVPPESKGWLSYVSTAVSIWAAALLVLGGSSKYWSPWRLVWRLFPALNDAAFPDLNGEWEGTTSSNWPVIGAMKEHAIGEGKLNMESLEDVELQSDRITLRVQASLFKLNVTAQLHGTDSLSHSITARVLRDEARDEFDLSYIYRQETPQAGLLDEASHLGAAVLRYDRDNDKLCGQYWTKRRWRMGLNTAGLIEVTRTF